MRIFFMGTTKFGNLCMTTAINCNMEVVGCAYTPQKFNISYAPKGVNNVNYYDFTKSAKKLGIPCIAYERENMQGFIKRVGEMKPDLILVAGWYYMIPKALREKAPKGTIGLHASLLPQYRGGAPLVWAMINGEKQSGLSLFYIEDGVDTGDIIGQQVFEIEERDTISTMLKKVDEAAILLLRQYLPLIAVDKAPRMQQDHEKATVFPQRTPEDGLIDWNQSTEKIKNFIRAQTKPYPGAFTYINGKKLLYGMQT